MEKTIREKALQLRNAGWSYTTISSRIGVAKSTLSNWLSQVPYMPNATTRRRVKAGPRRSGQLRQAQKNENIKAILDSTQKELGDLTRRDIFLLGIGLYMGEGTKSHSSAAFANANPEIITLMMYWFREVCHVPDGHFRITMYLHPDHDEQDSGRYWSKITGVPKDQFIKTQVDLRPGKKLSKRKMLPYGTIRIGIAACQDSRFGVQFHRQILGWIQAAFSNQRV